MYAAIDLESKLILDTELFGRHGTDPAAAFLHRLAEQLWLSDLARLWLRGRRDYTDRNLIEKWFQTLKQRIDRINR